MPSRMLYWIAAAIFLAGAAGAALFLLQRLEALQNRLIHVVVPGEAILALPEAGAYTIFHEPQSVVDGTLYSAEDISGLTISLRSPGTGQAISLTQPGATTSYTLGGRQGTSIIAFEIATPGDFRLSAGYADGRAEPQTVLAIGKGVVANLFGAILGALGISLGAFAVAVTIATITFLKRRSAMRAAPAHAGLTS